MNKKRLIIPALSLSAIIVATKLTGDFNSINIYSTDLSKENVSFYTDETIPERIESNLRYTFNHTNMVPQGLTISDDYFFISMYDYYHLSNSMINVYDKDGNFVNSCELDNKAHVGGITYDNKNKNIWITDTKGTISGYKLDDIIKSKDEVKPIYKQIDVSNKLINIYSNKATAYNAYFDNKIYVGNFNKGSVSYLKTYIVDKEGTINIDSENIIGSVPASQGITFYQNDNNTYLFVSSSFGLHIPSQIKIYKYHDDIKDLKDEPYINLVLPPMLEQIYVDDNKLLAVFESNAEKYKSKRNNTPDFIEISLDYIIDDINTL